MVLLCLTTFLYLDYYTMSHVIDFIPKVLARNSLTEEDKQYNCLRDLHETLLQAVALTQKNLLPVNHSSQYHLLVLIYQIVFVKHVNILDEDIIQNHSSEYYPCEKFFYYGRLQFQIFANSRNFFLFISSILRLF